MRGIVRKWRPPLALVVGGALVGVFALPILGLVSLRLWGDVLGWGEAATLVVVLALVATTVLGLLLWRLVLRPVYALTDYARAMKAGEAPQAPTQFGTPEFSALGASVMAMGNSLHSRAEGMKAYSDHVAHELTSPLTAIRGAAELLETAPPPDDAATLSTTIRAASDRMQTLLDDLGHHARAATSAGPGTSRLSAVAADLPEMPLDIGVAADGAVPLAAQDLHTILTQLARNAAEHGATRLDLSVLAAGIQVTDDGPGISAGNRARIFDPFFTTRREQGGTGMGLSIVRSLLAARGGRISLADSTQGAAFLITFD
ncbi:HAMP domain-containing sensor histidine kinase [uncultured Tateyamaria sp.]|uniref:sensor histidine kinase n=1 Tax=uncultured Tateyamaria sp. TaxID=455651 RepID=UPI0026183D92|nr:HAMP domain-containing sensor histidine kinase [uncultured Tateyamaria sp.]